MLLGKSAKKIVLLADAGSTEKFTLVSSWPPGLEIRAAASMSLVKLFDNPEVDCMTCKF